MPKINKTKYALLGMLNMGPSSGYDLKRYCDFSISNFWNENYAHIYPVLRQMEDEGLVTKETEFNKGRPPKNIYTITENGKKKLNKWLITPVEDDPTRNELLLKIFFSGETPDENIIKIIMQKKEENEKLLDKYTRLENQLTSEEPYKGSKELPLWLATVRYGIMGSRFMIDWCTETLKSLKEMNMN